MRAYEREEIRREEIRREEIRRAEIGRARVRSAKRNKKNKVSSLDILLCVIAILLIINLVFMAMGIDVSELPKSVSVIWWSVVSFVVAVLASWGM